jgi:orotate phosphoribosyltransferase-like protein
MSIDIKNPYNLTKCKKTSIRRRTLCGRTVWYYTYHEPKGLDKRQRRSAIDSFKHPQSELEKIVSSNMISEALFEFLKERDINEFDLIIGVPSSSGVVKTVIDKILSDCDFKGAAIYKGFKKTRVRNVKLKQHALDRENSEKTKTIVPSAIQHSKRLHYDKVSKVSYFPTRFRRYVENFLRLDIANSSLLTNKKVLVVDDTFGEGLTLCEVSRILEPYTKNVVGFTIMKDVSQIRNKLETPKNYIS